MPYRDAGAGPLACARHAFAVAEHACAECSARLCLACTTFTATRARCAACAKARGGRRAALLQALVLFVGSWLPLGAGALIFECMLRVPPRAAHRHRLDIVARNGAHAPRVARLRRGCGCLGCPPPTIASVQPNVWRQPPAPHPLAAFAAPQRPIY